MKRLFALFLSVVSLGAAEIKLAWNPSDTPGCNYILYGATNGALTFANSNLKTNVGTNLIVSVSTLQMNQWQFGVTAFKGGIESDMSNILMVDVPLPVKGLRIVIP